jgi:tetratricopeptide (TPR) repeat protein
MFVQGKLSSAATGLLWLGLFLIHGACAHHPDVTARPTDRLEGRYQPGDYAAAIQKLEEIAKSHPDPAKRATAYAQLARLYCGYDNPAKDHRRALESLQKAVSLDPALAHRQEVQDLMALLSEIQKLSDSNLARDKAIEKSKRELERTTRKYESTAKDLETCRSDNIRFIQENVELKTSIERLKSLDIEIETKRKQYK